MNNSINQAALIDTTHVIRALAALAQETRLAIFKMLVQAGPEGIAASKLSEALEIPASSLSFHLKELTRSELIQVRQEGRFMIYSANFSVMNSVLGYLTENCCEGAGCAVPSCQGTC